MKIKNYEWNGFGFPIVFEELPAIRVRGELVPDVDWEMLVRPVVQLICTSQDVSFSGNQVKLVRHCLGMNLRNFAKFVGVTHQSVMRWEERGKSSARISAHTEIVTRIKILKALKSSPAEINKAIEKVEHVGKPQNYRQIQPLLFSNNLTSKDLAAQFKHEL